MSDFPESYVGELRKVLGNRRLIIPAIRAIIQDGDGRVLLIKRRDNGRWAFPAGSVEIDESVYGCLVREVKEETGLTVISATPFAIYSEPRFALTDDFGNEYQYVVVAFRVDERTGNLITITDETLDARFCSDADMPELMSHNRETLEDFKKFDGRVILK
jgi:8-oxo-dGTP pyrophosphatase MutT (NUDIX family)